MNWVYGESQHAYIAVTGAYRCRVYRERSGTWTAIVIHRAAPTEHEGFPNVEAAMAWCDDHVHKVSPYPLAATKTRRDV